MKAIADIAKGFGKQTMAEFVDQARYCLSYKGTVLHTGKAFI